MADIKFRGGTVGIAGAAEMERLLKLLPEKVAERVTKNALRAGARVIRNEAKARSADDPELSGAVVVRSPTQRERRKGAALVVVGIEQPVSRRAHLREFGTGPHTIRTKRKGVLADKETGAVFGTEVQHPGTPAEPFLRPAVDEGGKRAIDAIGKSMARGIDREAKKLAKT